MNNLERIIDSQRVEIRDTSRAGDALDLGRPIESITLDPDPNKPRHEGHTSE